MKNTPQFEVQLPAVVLTNGAKPASAEVSNTGGRFLTNRSGVENIFTREKLSDEQRNMQQTATDFALNEIAPNSPALRALNANTAGDLLKRTADLGLLAIDVQDGYDLVCLNSISSA
ncbi:MAG: acyl-CoA dehydrogenase family protein, partial [Calditrichota bacterium]